MLAYHNLHNRFHVQIASLGRRGLATESSADPATARLAAETAALNNEMFSFFGASDDGGDPLQQAPLSSSASPQPTPTAHAAAPTRASDPPPRLTHADETGRASMVDVGFKQFTQRTATAAARVLLGPTAFSLVAANQVAKGDVLTVAQLAGIMGAKHTSTLIPLCHPLLLSHVSVDLSLDAAAAAVEVRATATTAGPTGVEMEAMTAATVAALTVYDMCKAASKSIEITDVRLLRKTGGKSGEWVREEEESDAGEG